MLVSISTQAHAFAYGNFLGTDVDFLGVTDTTTSAGDPDRMFGGVIGPVTSGNQLLFFPTDFSASAAGGPPTSADSTSALLNLTIASSNPAFSINELLVTEFGNVDLSGLGTASASVSLGGQLTVTEVNFAPMTLVIPFSATFSPNANGAFSLPGDVGSQLWNGSFLIDVAAELVKNGLAPFATRAVLQLDDNLDATSEAGTTALIQKDVVSGPVITIAVIPEPGTGLLLGAGLLALAARRRVAGRGAASSEQRRGPLMPSRS